MLLSVMESESNEADKKYGKTWPQVLAILIGSLAGITNGLLASWPSPFLIKITQDKENYDISEEEGSYFNTIQPIAMIVACPFFAKLSDVIGRKSTLLLIAVPQTASWLLAGFAKSVYVFYASRICVGIADGCFFSSVPAYIGEVANPTVRGTWGNAVPFGIYLGEFLITVIGSYFSVTVTSYICMPLILIFFIFFITMPESPYFYIMKGEEEKAKNSLRFFNRIEKIDNIYLQLKRDVERQLSESGTWFDIIKIDSNRKALLAGVFLRVTQQLSGLTVFMTTTQFIFQKSGGDISHEMASMVYMGLAIVLNVSALIIIVPRFGRITCFAASTLMCSIVLFSMSIYMYINDNTNIDVSSFNWIPIAGMVLHQVGACYGICVIPTLMLSELFSASIKSKAMIIMTLTFGGANFATTTFFYNLNSLFGIYSPFLFFGVCCALSTFLSLYIIPETKDKTLEEIQQMLKSNGKKVSENIQ